jgi:uncharacterized protein YcnI
VLTRRIAAVAAGIALGAVALAGSAFAHVEVSGKPAQALAQNAVISFSAEAESASAGIASVHVVLPQGITAADVTLVSGPTGWKLSPASDGFTLAGKALGVHKDAKYSIQVRQLPDAKSLAFKTLVNYSNGDVDRWIEIPSASNPNPDHPAPVLKLAAAASPTTAPAQASASPSIAASDPGATAPAVGPGVDGTPARTSPVVWILFIVLAGIAAALAITFVRRRMAR